MSDSNQIKITSETEYPTIGEIYGAYLQAFARVRSGGTIEEPSQYDLTDPEEIDILIAASLGAAHGKSENSPLAFNELLDEVVEMSDLGDGLDGHECASCGGPLDEDDENPFTKKTEVKPAS